MRLSRGSDPRLLRLAMDGSFDAPQEATPRFKVVRTKWPRLVDLTRSCFRSEAENDIAPQTKLGA